MRPLFRAALDRLVRNEPGVAATTPVAPARVAPARNVRFVGVGNAEREAIERRFSFGREMENIFVAVVQKAGRTDRLEMSARNFFAGIVRDRDRFDPVNRVLQNEEFAQSQDQLVRQHRIRRRRADVEKKRSVRPEQPADLRRPFFAPIEIRCAIRGVGKFAVANPEIVRRRRDHEIDRSSLELRHSRYAIAEVEIELSLNFRKV